MKKIISIIAALCCSTFLLHAQLDVLLQQAQTYMSNFDYKTAIELLEPQAKKKKVRLETFELLGKCYMALENRERAAFYYKQRIDKGGNIPPEILLQYGKLLLHEGNYEEAKTYFQACLAAHPDTLTYTFIASCDTAMLWMAKKDTYNVFVVENLKRVNGKFHDWGALRSKNGIMFMSDRPRTKNGKSGFYTVYQSNFRKDSTLGAPNVFFNKLREDIHVGPVAFTKDEKTIFYTQTNLHTLHRDKTDDGTVWENKLELIIAKINNKRLSSTKSFKHNNPRKYSVGHACLSPNDSVLYYVSDMPGGFGGTDLYYSELESGGEWSAPVNAGPMINTAGNEMFPTMDTLGILYFSSNGRVGLGGLDIFRAKGEKDKWSIVENMRHPINSCGDDFYLVLANDKKSGFLSSNRPGGEGHDDVYSLTVTGPFPDFGYIGDHAGYEKMLRRLAEKKTFNFDEFTGTVTDGATQKGIDSVTISFVNDATKEQVICTTDSTGTFSVFLDRKENYTYSCIREGYVPTIGQPLASGDTLAQLLIEMTPVKITAENVIADNVVLDTEQGKGIKYRVQIMARKEYPDWEYLDKAKEVYPNLKILYRQDADFTRFTIGEFKKMREATRLKNELRKIGYEDAFVVMFVNGKRKVISYK
jgi:tetratricopeptide (TPR) repeat protein